MRYFFLFFFALFTIVSFGQNTRIPRDEINSDNYNPSQTDSLYNNRDEISIELDGETHYTDYKIITYEHDTLVIDTTLSMKKDYKFNFLRKDNFELMAFQNQGQTFNKLGYDFSSSSFIPKMGMSAKYYAYKEVEDIRYYEVPTPTSEFMWRTGMEQGQVLDALFTMNKSPQFNMSFEYTGLRSLGKYRRTLASLGLFRMTLNYHTKNDRYFARGHFASQKIKNEENGGLTDQSVLLFESGDSEFTDRGRLDVNFTDAENQIRSKRYHFEHDFKFFKEKDSISEPSNLKLGHYFTYETTHYTYTQTANDILGDAYTTKINDDTGLKTMNNLVFLDFVSPYVLGNFRAKTNYYTYNHYFTGIVNLVDDTIDAQIDGGALSVGLEWNAKIKNFSLKADVSSIIVGDIDGNSLLVAATYQTDSIFSVTGKISHVSKIPNFNYLHFQSDYIDYNWQNEDFKNEQIRNLEIDFNSEKWLDATAGITQIENYTYFDSISKPQQSAENLSYLKIKVHKAFTYKKFTLDNTLMYQNVATGSDVFRVPEFVTRNSLYFTSYLFKKKPLYLQTGITFKYFSKYKMNAYNSLLAEFYMQEEIYGGFPLFDFFVNAQVRRTRLFFKIENFTSSFTGRDYYSAPINPYRDLNVRFGVVWNFFI